MVVFGIIVQAHDVMLQKYTIFAEGEVAEVILEQILNFFTGADYSPPLGFDQHAALWFSPLADMQQ